MDSGKYIEYPWNPHAIVLGNLLILLLPIIGLQLTSGLEIAVSVSIKGTNVKLNEFIHLTVRLTRLSLPESVKNNIILAVSFLRNPAAG